MPSTSSTAPKTGKKSADTRETLPSPFDRLSEKDCLALFEQLFLARYFDVRLIKEKKRGRLRGTLYSSHNQEAVIVGSLYGLKPYDWISPIHRDMPMFFLKDAQAGLHNPERMGFSIEEVCAQVWCKAGSPNRARDNWSHLGSREKHIIHSTSMLAGTIPVAAGVAWMERAKGSDAVVLTFNGEGSTAQGVFHEAVNFAAVRKLPVITIIENNEWAYGTPVHLECPTEDVADRAKGYGIPGFVADGQDVFDVYDKVMQAVEWARAGNGPSIVECKTFRAYGHGDHDDDRAAKYRDSAGVARGRSRDPIGVCRAKLLELGYLEPSQATDYVAEGKNASEATSDDFPPEVVAYLDAGIQHALQSPEPPAEEGGMWVFKE